MLTKLQCDFLSVLKSCFCNKNSIDLSPYFDFEGIFNLAGEHKLIPLILNRIHDADSLPPQLREFCLQSSFSSISSQVSRQEKFLEVYDKLIQNGINAIVLKGIILRDIYPMGDCRSSCDEDIFVPPEQAVRARQIIEDCGMGFDYGEVDELVFSDDETRLIIELHTKFIEDFVSLEHDFESYSNPEIKIIDGTELRTLSYTENCLYIVFHIYQHLLVSGVGIRQLCDLFQFINVYSDKIDWNLFFDVLEKNKLRRFFEALVNIGHQYLFLDERLLETEHIDVDELVEDIMSSGIYGGSEEERSFINSYMLSATQKRSDSRLLNRLRMVFPNYCIMKKRYSYINQKPFLLPVAWVNRWFRIIKNGEHKSSKKSIAKAESRLMMFFKYGILEKKD